MTLIRLHPFWSAMKIASKMHQLGSPLIGERNVRNYIYRLGYKFKKPSKLMRLTSKLKSEWFQWYKKQKKTNWKNVLFIDESTIWAHSVSGKGWFKNDYNWPLYCKDYGKFNMIGGISSQLKTKLKIFEGNLNSQKLIDILEDILQIAYIQKRILNRWVFY